MSMVQDATMKVLLLKNYPSATPADHAIVQSFTENIRRSNPTAQIDICCIANGEAIPNALDYGLVILSGGRVNLLEANKPKWALDVLDMVRSLAKQSSKTKLLGICWGHQAIHYALGGSLAWLERRPRVSLLPPATSIEYLAPERPAHNESQIGVQKMELTPKGQSFFQRNALVCVKSRLQLGLQPEISRACICETDQSFSRHSINTT